MKCEFCKREITNPGSLAAHRLVCAKNPNNTSFTHSPDAGARKGCTTWNKGKKIGPHKRWRQMYPNEQIFVENSSYNRKSLKKRILDDELIEYVCDICGLGPEWNGKPMTLVLDHINGVNNDNRLENIRFVCNNCDSQLPTYKSRNR